MMMIKHRAKKIWLAIAGLNLTDEPKGKDAIEAGLRELAEDIIKIIEEGSVVYEVKTKHKFKIGGAFGDCMCGLPKVVHPGSNRKYQSRQHLVDRIRGLITPHK